MLGGIKGEEVGIRGRVLYTGGKVLYHRVFFFFQAEDGIRDLVRSRGLGDGSADKWRLNR